MPKITSDDYHDYVIKGGELIGEFEQMYQRCEDPWHISEYIGSLQYELFAALVARQSKNINVLLEVGCGLGEPIYMISQMLPETKILACDISATAIAKARERYPGINFFQYDLFGEDPFPFDEYQVDEIDAITLSETLWYILPKVNYVLQKLYSCLKHGGYLFVKQCFYTPDNQQYGREIVGGVSDFIRLLSDNGFKMVHQVHVDPRSGFPEQPDRLLLWAKKV